MPSSYNSPRGVISADAGIGNIRLRDSNCGGRIQSVGHRCEVRLQRPFGKHTLRPPTISKSHHTNAFGGLQQWVWGLSIAGETGVRHVMKSLLAEFDILMNVAGYAHLEDIDRDAIDSLPRVAIMPSESTIT